MILDELILENVGTFKGRHQITLTPPGKTRPIVLIGGLNGAGKTTMLESIQLALYGSLAQISRRRGGSYEAYLRSLIHRGVPDTTGATIELAFTAFQEGVSRQFRVRRHWHNTGQAVREALVVWVDGRLDQALTATWTEHVETFLPRGIAGLFFFDGEQIEALADLDRSRQVLASALAALLGLDLVDRLSADLAVVRRRHRNNQIPEELREDLERRQQAVTAIRQTEESAAELAATARVAAERADKRLFQVRERYRSAGGDLLDQREPAEATVAALREQLVGVESQIRDEAAGVAPFLQLGQLLEQLVDQAQREHQGQRDKMVADVLAQRDQVVLEQLTSAKVRASTVASMTNFLAADLDERRAASRVEMITGMADPGSLPELRTGSLPASRRRLKVLCDQRASLRSNLDDAERVLVAIPDVEELAPLLLEVEEAHDDALRSHASLEQTEERLRLLRQDRDRADRAYESAMDKAAHANLAADDERRLVEHLDRVRVTLESLRKAATARHLTQIAGLVHEALGRLMRKDQLVTAVSIDAESNTVQLTGVDGHSLSAEELSAGERQLLAVALLWGLARAAGQPLPMMIDTPLGRLDGMHRERLLERYYPHASHQVILLSTDTEIDAAAYRRIEKYVGLSYRLEFNPQQGATTVVPGYFWE